MGWCPISTGWTEDTTTLSSWVFPGKLLKAATLGHPYVA